MKSTELLQKNVIDELAWDPQVDSSDIAVTIEENVAVLGGHVGTYAEMLAAEKAARRVIGVKGVVDKIEVRLGKAHMDSDATLVARAADILRFSTIVPADRIKVVVQDAWIKLSGDVRWQFQKEAAENAVRHLNGIKGVMNEIRIFPAVATSVIKDDITAAFRRNAEFDASQIKVDAIGSKVTLTGTVRSWTERRSAEVVAWSATGVTEVINDIVVESPVVAW